VTWGRRRFGLLDVESLRQDVQLAVVVAIEEGDAAGKSFSTT